MRIKEKNGLKKKCAECGDKNQTNIITVFIRDKDLEVFHICGRCAEKGVDAEKLTIKANKTYTTILQVADKRKKYIKNYLKE